MLAGQGHVALLLLLLLQVQLLVLLLLLLPSQLPGSPLLHAASCCSSAVTRAAESVSWQWLHAWTAILQSTWRMEWFRPWAE
jgi:hypothetical protein